MKLETIKQFTRKGYVRAGGIITLIAGIATIYAAFHDSGPEHNPAFLGRWESNYQHPVPGGSVAFNGITEYFRNGRYNVNGTLKFSGGAADKPFSAVVLTKGSGTWTADNKFLTFTLTGLHTEPTSFKSGELEMPIPLLEKLSGYSLPDLNKQYVPGSSDEYEIVSQERQRIVLEGKDPFGNPFTVVTSRPQ
ncbi:hypothetical protein C2E19_16115 [Pseudomonas sp. DTU12.3]|uniref:hypothetical protein n=1 Tax=Pseudomonas sp. DTU12.3 TaxID=2073078 RepID=UPI001011D404|nr:hypothetical protein [Pseudomonas sp. DTU12.3]QAX85287.1 hypothetical protein C2E19_16115 [Pseudomonas sp. DTU12.3]